PLSFGTMTFADGADEAMAAQLYARCRDAGINLFDCANVYAGGDSERFLGRFVRGHRDEVVLATKAYYPTGEGANTRGLSRRHLTQSLHASLERLNTEYVDVFYLHAFDCRTPLEESLSALKDFQSQGKILYVGISNFAAWQAMKAIAAADGIGLAIHCLQPMYNLVKRQAETELLPMAADQDMAVMPYSPLAGGVLTGKYLRGTPDNTRLSESAMYRDRYRDEWVNRAAAGFVDTANELGVQPASLAIAWVMAHPAVTSPLIGARNTDQLNVALEALDIDMTDELRDRLSALTPAPALATDRSEEKT
ncbi:MAG: aldo/keto reductase, partial [Pseudomonadota bacterium]